MNRIPVTRIHRADLNDLVTARTGPCISLFMPLVGEDDRYFLLAISQNCVRFFQGNSSELRELTISGLPKNLADAIKVEDFDRGEQVHSAKWGAVGKEAAAFHGQGGKPETIK